MIIDLNKEEALKGEKDLWVSIHGHPFLLQRREPGGSIVDRQIGRMSRARKKSNPLTQGYPGLTL